MMSNPDLMRMASESMKNMRPEDLKYAAEQLKHARPEDMAEMGEKMATSSPEEIAAMRARIDAQVNYKLDAAQLLKKQGNELHSQGKFKDASEKYLLAKSNIQGIPNSSGRTVLLSCSLSLMSCYLKTGQYDECVNEGSEVLAYDKKNLKALYRRGQAYRELGRLEEAVSDLCKAREVSPGNKTIADVLRDAKDRLDKEGGQRSSRLVIEEITDSVESISSSKPSLSSEYPVGQPNVQTKARKSTPETNSECLQALKDDLETIRSFQNFISNADPNSLAAFGGGEELSPDMLKIASNMIIKMSPEELQRMAAFGGGEELSPDMLKIASNIISKMSPEELQRMAAFGGGEELSPDMLKIASNMISEMPPEELQRMAAFGGGEELSPDMLKIASNMISKMPPEELQRMAAFGGVEELSPDMLKIASNMISKMPPEELQRMAAFGGVEELSPDMLKIASNMISKMSPELQRMVQMASSFQGPNPFTGGLSDGNANSFRPGVLPQNVSPEMLQTATDMMSKMPAEDMQKMFEMASSLGGQTSIPTAAASSSRNNLHSDPVLKSSEAVKSSINESNVLGETSTSRSGPSPPSFPNSAVDLQEQMKNQMKDPALRQMMSNPDLMRMASESMKNMRPEDLKYAAEQLKHARPEDMAEMGEKMANSSPEEIAAMRARIDAQVNYKLDAAQLLKKQGNELHSQGKFKDASEKYLLAKNNIQGIPNSSGRTVLLACSLNLMSCYLKTGQYDECVNEGSEILAYDKKNLKALYRRGQAYRELGRLEEAVSDLCKAREVSPGNKTIADVLRDAKDRLDKEGGQRSSRLVIEEITDSVESIISKFQNFISNADPNPLAAFGGGEDGEELFPDMLKIASNMISKMSPEELQRMVQDTCLIAADVSKMLPEVMQKMFEMAYSLGGQTSIPTAAAFGGGEELSPDMLKIASNMISKMSPELQRMVQMASSFQGPNPFTGGLSDGNANSFRPGVLPQNVSPEMLQTATDMMSKMPAEDMQKMFEMASSLGGQTSIPTAAASSSRNNLHSDPVLKSSEAVKSSINESNVLGETSTSRSGPSPPSFPNSAVDLQEQMKNQMKDPALRQMFTSMFKNMDPDMIANMSELFGMKLSREDVAKAQKVMSSLSPEDLKRMMNWADRIHRGVEGVKKTKNWLLGRSGLILAICMLILAMILHRFGYIGR